MTDVSIEGDSYEVVRTRLLGQSRQFGAQLDALNARRALAFGRNELKQEATLRLRTEHNALPRDLLAIQGKLLLGAEVFLGLKKDTKIEDLFSLFQQEPSTEGLVPVDPSVVPGLLDNAEFVHEFASLFAYFKDARLVRILRRDAHLFLVFQTGATSADLKAFRFREDRNGITFLDFRSFTPSAVANHDFEWKLLTREDQVTGRSPHYSIEDVLFVETIHGDVTFKVENNTETGTGIYSEPVVDKNQVLDDAEFAYARVGALILVRIKPYREEDYRYFVYNTRSQRISRIDAIGASCLLLPRDQGIVFPGGFYLETDELKLFEADVATLSFLRMVRSPNGEDVLYVFEDRVRGSYLLLAYNAIRRELHVPLRAAAFTTLSDGRLLLLVPSDEPARMHTLQVWQTPFFAEDHVVTATTTDSLLSRIGNAELVKGIADFVGVRRLIEDAIATRPTYESLSKAAARARDAYYWLSEEDFAPMRESLDAIRQTASLIVDEFDKVTQLRSLAENRLADAGKRHSDLSSRVQSSGARRIEDFMSLLAEIRTSRGELLTARDMRYVDTAVVDALDTALVDLTAAVSRDCVRFLLQDDALADLSVKISEVERLVKESTRLKDIQAHSVTLDELASGLSLVSEVVQGLEVDDMRDRTTILGRISDVLAMLNRTRAVTVQRKKELALLEGRADFGAQVQLITQALASALSLAETPKACDEQLAKILLQVEELEGRFGDVAEFLADIIQKREEVVEAFAAHRQALVDARQRQVDGLLTSANRVIDGARRRSLDLKTEADVQAFFASDPMLAKVRAMVSQLHALDAVGPAEGLASRLKTLAQEALRGSRDRVELLEGDDIVKVGTHRFRMNREPFELTFTPRSDQLCFHITSTDYLATAEDTRLAATRPFWGQSLVSESASVYRGEYLAWSIFSEASQGGQDITWDRLHAAAREQEGLAGLVRQRAETRFDEGYQRGVHDADATLILERLLTLHESAGLLRYPSRLRALAMVFWRSHSERLATFAFRARSFGRLRSLGPDVSPASEVLAREVAPALQLFAATLSETLTEEQAAFAGRYLADELAETDVRFVTCVEADAMVTRLREFLERFSSSVSFAEDLRALGADAAARLQVARLWLRASHKGVEEKLWLPFLDEAAACVTCDDAPRQVSAAIIATTVTGLVGHHARIASGAMDLRLDEFVERLKTYSDTVAPQFREYRHLRQSILESERIRLRIEDFRPKVMSAFVRNRLISEFYLPLIGANLAKQIGAEGAAKRTDLMGMLLLISPPGYGKTTLMEYVASRLGMVFVKVNGPSLGHQVTSLDPNEAPNATARLEVEKVNLALEMGNNVMLYVDDIQHTNPEFLQKFISLCDATRRIEGVWKGEPKTYDLRGKQFSVVMAGNPYTESGDKFQIPDMLANRADTYNLGDITGGSEAVFALSYIENALTSCPELSSLADKPTADVAAIVQIAEGKEDAGRELGGRYSKVEIDSYCAVFRHMFRVRDVLMLVNAEYIRSASQADAYRTEPAFKLQGSYRNMNKICALIRSQMTAEEVDTVISDHYLGESQTLTTGAEHNLLKLAELRGTLTETQSERWTEIKRGFVRIAEQGSADADPATRITGTLSGMNRRMEGIADAITRGAEQGRARSDEAMMTGLSGLAERVELALKALKLDSRVEVHPQVDLHPVFEISALDLQPRIEVQAPQVELHPHFDVHMPQGAAPVQAPNYAMPAYTEAPSEQDSMLHHRVEELLQGFSHQLRAFEERLAPIAVVASRDFQHAQELHEHIVQLIDFVNTTARRARASEVPK